MITAITGLAVTFTYAQIVSALNVMNRVCKPHTLVLDPRSGLYPACTDWADRRGLNIVLCSPDYIQYRHRAPAYYSHAILDLGVSSVVGFGDSIAGMELIRAATKAGLTIFTNVEADLSPLCYQESV
jgi:hypothetical protein